MSKMLVTISGFAESRNVDRDTVNAFIRNHPEVKEHTKRQGKNVVIDTDSEGYEILDKQYPLPQMIQIIEDTESRQKLIQAQELIIKLQNKITEQAIEIAEKDTTKALLEDKSAQLDKTQAELENARETILELNKELAMEQSKTWFQKLIGK